MKSKARLFQKELVDLAELAKSIAHPARIAILQILIKNKRNFCGEIVDILPLSQPAISRHLSELVKIGLVSQKSLGTKVCYSVNTDKLKSFCSAFQKTIKKSI